MKFSKIVITLLVLLPLLTSAQKIKYKDIFPTLNSKGFTPEVEAQLKQFLSASKKPHPNGNYQLGVIYEERFYDLDVLSDTTQISQSADSATNQFKLAISLINEKELKNDEYYQAFHRRDLRTGEFGIKLSDVHLDLETRIEEINTRKKAIREFNTLLHRINGRNKLSATIYKQLVGKADSRQNLLFSIEKGDLVMLDRMSDNAKGLYTLANDLKESSKDLGTEYFQNFSNFKFIDNHGVDGVEQVDIFDGSLELWDYETWATGIKNDYYGVQEYKNIIGKKEEQIKTAQQMILEGQSPQTVSTGELDEDMAKYDSDGPAKPILDLKSSKLEVSKLGNPAINTLLSDTTNVFAQLDAASKIMEELGTMSVVYSDISGADKISIASNRYPGILETYYGGSTGYDQFIKDLGSWLNEQKIVWGNKTSALEDLNKWAVSETDRVPLFEQGTTDKYLTLGVNGDSMKIAFGLKVKTKESFVVWSGSDRGIRDMKSFKIGTMTTGTVVGAQIPTPYFAFYLYDTDATEKNLLLVATDGVGVVKWSNLVTVIQEPKSFRYDETLDQLTIFFYPEDQLPEGDIKAYIVIDRNGTVR